MSDDEKWRKLREEAQRGVLCAVMGLSDAEVHAWSVGPSASARHIAAAELKRRIVMEARNCQDPGKLAIVAALLGNPRTEQESR